MSTIHSYVESIFKDLPQNREILRLKSELLANMEDKYTDLISQNISEHEAIGIVISEFGNIDEIIEEFNIEKNEEKRDSHVLELSRNEAEAYMYHRQKFSLAMAIGVFLCIISVAILFLSMIIGSFISGNDTNNSFSLIGTILMLVTIAIGVGLFIVFGMQESQFPFEKRILQLDKATYRAIEEQYLPFKTKLSYAIAGGVVSCILGPVFLLLSIVFLSESRLLGVVFLMSFIAVGVFLFVYYGIQNDTYEKLLSVGSHTRTQVISNNYSEKIGSILFPLATLFYLYQGFVRGAWATAWIVYPIVAITLAIISAVVTGIANINENKH